MLIQAIKNDFKATYRSFVIIALLLIGVIGFGCIKNEIVSMFIAIFYSILFMYLTLGTFCYMINYYQKSMFKKEAYLFRTFPIKDWENIVSKLIITIFWMTCSIILGLLSAYVLSKINGYVVMNISMDFNDIITTIFEAVLGIVFFMLVVYLSINIAYIDGIKMNKTITFVILVLILLGLELGLEYLLTQKFFPGVLIFDSINPTIEWFIYRIILICVFFKLNLYFLKNKSAVENM